MRCRCETEVGSMSLSCFFYDEVEVEVEEEIDGHRFFEVSKKHPFAFSLYSSFSSPSAFLSSEAARLLTRCVALAESKLTGTFFCVMTATESAPLTPMAVLPAAFAALKAYSVFGLERFFSFKDAACERFGFDDTVAAVIKGGSGNRSHLRRGNEEIRMGGAIVFLEQSTIDRPRPFFLHSHRQAPLSSRPPPDGNAPTW